MNLQLANTEEYIDGQFTGNLGEVLIRCAHARLSPSRESACGAYALPGECRVRVSSHPGEAECHPLCCSLTRERAVCVGSQPARRAVWLGCFVVGASRAALDPPCRSRVSLHACLCAPSASARAERERSGCWSEQVQQRDVHAWGAGGGRGDGGRQLEAARRLRTPHAASALISRAHHTYLCWLATRYSLHAAACSPAGP